MREPLGKEDGEHPLLWGPHVKDSAGRALSQVLPEHFQPREDLEEWFQADTPPWPLTLDFYTPPQSPNVLGLPFPPGPTCPEPSMALSLFPPSHPPGLTLHTYSLLGEIGGL